jgi:hypothetical protein
MEKPPDAPLARIAPFIEIVLSVVRKICAGLVIIAFLSIIAAIAAALVAWVRERADKLFEKVFDLPESSKSEGKKGPMVVVPPGAGTQSPASVVGGSAAMSMAPIALAATVAGAVAAIVVGAITITVNSRPITAEPTANTPAATYKLGDISVTVPPKDIVVDASQIQLQQPNVNTSIPSLAFHFPQIPIDDRVMRDFASAMQNYSAALNAQSDHDRRLDELLTKALAAEQQNSELRAKLDMKPTQAQVEKLIAENEQRRKVDEGVRDALKSLADGTVEQEKGTSLGAMQYLRALNAQNEHYFNRFLRPGLVRRNCETYIAVEKQFKGKVAVPPCITPFWGNEEIDDGAIPTPPKTIKAASDSPGSGVPQAAVAANATSSPRP